MPSRIHFVQEIPHSVLMEEDLVDDSTGIIPTVGLGTRLSLRERFIRQLSKMLAATVVLKEDTSKRSMAISLSRDKPSPHPHVELDEELRKFIERLEEALATIATNKLGPQLDCASKDLWDAVLAYAYAKMDHVIHSLQRTFDDNDEVFADFITKMFGIDDIEEGGVELDRELGNRLILLYHAVKGYKRSMDALGELIRAASKITRAPLHLPEHLEYLLGNAQFANELYQLICTLGFPERVHSTLLRAARTSNTFQNVTFNLRPSHSTTKRVSFATPIETSSQKTTSSPRPPPPPVKLDKSKRIQRFEAAVEPQLQAHSQPPSTALGPVLHAAQPYLAQEDRGIALVRLSPASLQDVVQLAGTILQNHILPFHVNAWYAFGFVTLKDKAEEQHLGGLYATLLKEAQDPQTIFRDLQNALETNTLVKLFDVKGYKDFRQCFPRLEAFLNTAPVKRSTAWRLKQFVQDADNTEPPACLQRDYGFKFCRQRDEVLRLKAIYARMLNKMGPKNVHNACMHGRLFETAKREGLLIDLKDKRLMQNDFPSPFVGFDNEDGLAAYRGPFFKRHLKL